MRCVSENTRRGRGRIRSRTENRKRRPGAGLPAGARRATFGVARDLRTAAAKETVKAIIFDAGNTLVWLGRWTELDCHRIAAIHELPEWLDRGT